MFSLLQELVVDTSEKVSGVRRCIMGSHLGFSPVREFSPVGEAGEYPARSKAPALTSARELVPQRPVNHQFQ